MSATAEVVTQEAGQDKTSQSQTTDTTQASGQAVGTQTAQTTQTTQTTDQGTQTTEVKATWPENWRQSYAKGDDKKLKHLERYASPEAALDAMIAAQNRIRSGELATKLPENPTPEQVAQWRQENGIPESPDKYDLKFDSGLVIGDVDKPFIDDFLKSAHENNMSPSHVKAAIEWWHQNREKQVEARYEADQRATQEAEDTLRAEWGQEYRTNVNRVKALLEQAPEGVKDKISNARLEDGTPLASDPDTLRFLVGLARDLNPVSSLVPGAGVNVKSAIDDELKTLETKMGNKNSDYWKGPFADKNQQRYRELMDAKMRMK